MLKLSKADLASIGNVLYNKARDIDVAIYNALLDPSYKDFVLDSLMLYVTKDGGIGNALHIDNYNPNASVYQTYEALRILAALQFDKTCENELYPQLLNKIGNYLFNRCLIEDGLWNPLVESNDQFAHSEEFSYMKNPFSTWGVHPTAAILGYILELMPPSKAYYKKALKQINFIFAYLNEEHSWNMYNLTSYSSLLSSLKRTGLFPKEAKQIEQMILKKAKNHLDDPNFNFPLLLKDIEVDALLKDKINMKLDEMLSCRASHGLWEHRKSWKNKKYPEEDSAALKWLGAETVWNLYLLKQYGRIEE
ncbi:MAG: hypothetical protein NC310_03435 [Roseburia sp.]|nr:hypothetical protein [Anaeroplasma bactoclasticum]MCM1196112.1 hypothetical protein [Roseburia sp.]